MYGRHSSTTTIQDPEGLQREREAARVQWVRELEAQRVAQQSAKEREKREAKAAVYSSCVFGTDATLTLSASRDASSVMSQSQSQSVTGARRRNQAEIRQHASQPPPASSITSHHNLNRNHNHNQHNQQQTQPPSEQSQQLFPRTRSHFTQNQTDPALALQKRREAEEWREALREQIEDKKRREEAARALPEVTYASWGETQRPGSHGGSGPRGGSGAVGSGSVTGLSVRKSAGAIAAEAQRDAQLEDGRRRELREVQKQTRAQLSGLQGMDVQKREDVPGLEAGIAAPAAEPVTPVTVLSRIPRARPTPKRNVAPANPLDWGLDLHETVPEDDETTPATKPSGRPALKKAASTERKGALLPDISSSTNHLAASLSHNSLHEPEPAHSRSPSPPPRSHQQQKQQQQQMSPNKKLANILGSVKTVAYPQPPAPIPPRRAAAATARERPRSAFGRTLPAVKGPRGGRGAGGGGGGGGAREAKERREREQREEAARLVREGVEKGRRERVTALHRTVVGAPGGERGAGLSGLGRGGAGGDGELERRVEYEEVPAAGARKGGGHGGRNSEFTPGGSLRPPWGVVADDGVEGGRREARDTRSSKQYHAGTAAAVNGMRPPWGIEEDVPVRVVARERKVLPAGYGHRGRQDSVQGLMEQDTEDALRARALNELSRFGSMLAREQRALHEELRE
ncbi:hypothetical protein BC830DRAFT_1134626 [Chytriomyces sp. MP71]|nr:hypothetical protein BC830DRAFT_1134626 [Chytriomyces sp. MP71]